MNPYRDTSSCSMVNMYCKLDWSSNLPAIHLHWNKWIWCYVDKTEANLASARALAARCVRVIHAQCVLQFALLSRTLLRSSSNNEPSDPPYRIVFFSVFLHSIHIQWQTTMTLLNGKVYKQDSKAIRVYTYATCLVSYIMVRHNHIGIYVTVRSSYVLMIELNKFEQKR